MLLPTAFVFAHKRAAKNVFIAFKLWRPTTELLHSIAYMIELTGRESVGIMVVLNARGVSGRDRSKYKKHLPLLVEFGCVTVKPYKNGESVSITELGYNIIDYYNKQFYSILQAGETKYKKRLKYGYLEQLPDLRK